MSVLVQNMHWVMLASGLLTLTMPQGVFAPRATMRALFGEEVDGAGAELIVRNWSALVAGGGALLICGAWSAEWRAPILIFVGLGKLCFIALVLAHGRRFLRRQAGVAAGVDAAMVCAFAFYLAAVR